MLRRPALAAVVTVALGVALDASLATPVGANDEPGELRVVSSIDSAIIVGAMAASLVPMTIRLRDPVLWDHQLFGEADHAPYDRLSRPAGRLSDLALLAALTAPAVYLTGPTIDDADGDRLVLYGETLAIDLALVQLAKYLVQRPRPYLYSHSPEAARLAAESGDDAWRSFYSSHAAMSFGAAVAGAYLLGETGVRPAARAAAWATGFAFAAATSNLRVRAGMHFYSDVIVGGLVGAAVGYAVPALHARGEPYAPRGADLAAAGAGLLAGTVLSELIPLGSPGAARASAVTVDRVHIGPLAVRDGGGVAISGRVRSRWNRMPLSREMAAE
jgi:membrane-associated phospholipid phosphatase